MAEVSKRLSDVKVRAIKEAGFYADGNGLYLNVTAKGSRSWIFRHRFAGRRRDMGLGSYPTVSLADARNQVAECRAMLQRGEDPMPTRRVAPITPQIVTFADAARQYITTHEQSWKNDKHRQQWRNTIEGYCVPVIGALPISEVSVHNVLTILEPIWLTKMETASRIRGRLETILDWAEARGLREGDNPARWRGKLKHLLPAQRQIVRHHPAMPYGELAAFMGELRENPALSARALELTILTASRTSEVVRARWSEFDLNQKLWERPPERMKTNKEHRVPLSDAAMAVIGQLPRVVGCDFVFPGARFKRPLSNMAMLELLRGMRPGLTVHGFRSTFRDWAAECTGTSHEVVEMALAHAIQNKVEAAYRRGDLLEKRRRLMEAWASFCYREAGEVVVPLSKAAKK